jgi:hypothetical protein
VITYFHSRPEGLGRWFAQEILSESQQKKIYPQILNGNSRGQNIGPKFQAFCSRPLIQGDFTAKFNDSGD